MKKILKAFVEWLDRKYPDKVTVTLAEYQKLHQDIVWLKANAEKEDIIAEFENLKRKVDAIAVAVGIDSGIAPMMSQLGLTKFQAGR